jgi:hypothetical protein
VAVAFVAPVKLTSPKLRGVVEIEHIEEMLALTTIVFESDSANTGDEIIKVGTIKAKNKVNFFIIFIFSNNFLDFNFSFIYKIIDKHSTYLFICNRLSWVRFPVAEGCVARSATSIDRQNISAWQQKQRERDMITRLQTIRKRLFLATKSGNWRK